jgi:hypothetical protein
VQAMAEHALPLIRRIIKEALFEWVQAKQLVPIDKVFKEISSRERLGPRERESCGRVIYEFVRYWNCLLPKNFNPQVAPQLHHFDEILTSVINENNFGIKKHLSSKPKFEEDPVPHLRKYHTLPDFLFQEMNREANTLGSKAGSLEMTRAAMNLKLLIEQMREQAMNLE